jgi:hypothetical protein
MDRLKHSRGAFHKAFGISPSLYRRMGHSYSSACAERMPLLGAAGFPLERSINYGPV